MWALSSKSVFLTPLEHCHLRITSRNTKSILQHWDNTTVQSSQLSRSSTSNKAIPTSMGGVSSSPVPWLLPKQESGSTYAAPPGLMLLWQRAPQLNSLFCHHKLFFIKLWICFLQRNEQNMSWKMKTNGVISSKKNTSHLLLQITLLFVDKMVSQH